jgi:N-acetylglucosamine kinase-like BadF-type ATPase
LSFDGGAKIFSGGHGDRPCRVLCVDGGGSKTSVLVAELGIGAEPIVKGRSLGGPANLRLAGQSQSLANLDIAIDQALGSAGFRDGPVDVAVLALAGSAQEDVKQQVRRWAEQRQLAASLIICHDAEPVMQAGTPEGWGVALIVGTGSVVTGISAEGDSVMRGGWGHWFGDRGSGYDIGRRALTAASEASDGMGPDTLILDLLLQRYSIGDLREILQRLAAETNLRKAIAGATPLVMDAAAKGDAIATRIIDSGADSLARTVARVASELALEDYTLALAGGVITGSELYRRAFLASLELVGAGPHEINLVTEPVRGCLRMAQRHIEKSGRTT